MSRRGPTRILVVGQTPPPFGGQTIMIQHLLDGEYPGYELLHQRMGFSREMEEVGGFHVRKLFELIRVILGIVAQRIIRGPRILYYPPAGPMVIPVLRDLVILGVTRWMFRRTIFHFHAGGVGEFEEQLPPPLRPVFRLAYLRPDAGIRISGLAPPDPEKLQAKSEFIIPNAVEDHGAAYVGTVSQSEEVEFLYVGLISEAKGVEVLLEACEILEKEGKLFRLRLVGPSESARFAQRIQRLIASRGVQERVILSGELTGADKWQAFASADAFCFPTHHPSETFGIVLLEALSFSLPVVATRWRGTADIVEDGSNGFLVPVRDARSLAARMKDLIADPGLRREMGTEGRRRFLRHFTLARYHDGFRRVFESVADPTQGRNLNG